jgi:hypothetical protein
MTSLVHRVFGVAHRFQQPPRCTVCGQVQDESHRLISGRKVAICEQCITLASTSSRAARDTTVEAASCSFCERKETPIAGSWRKLTICVECVGVAQRILVEDERDRSQ